MSDMTTETTIDITAIQPAAFEPDVTRPMTLPRAVAVLLREKLAAQQNFDIESSRREPSERETQDRDYYAELRDAVTVVLRELATDYRDAARWRYYALMRPHAVVKLCFPNWPHPMLRGYHEETAATLEEAMDAAMALSSPAEGR
jgi:hypothetical protein